MNTRQVYLDWLRIMAIAGMLFFHAAMAFVAEEEWHIKNGETSNLLLEFNFWLSRFRMPLLFFISGAISWWIMQSKTAYAFIGLRFKRLLLPLIFGMLLIVPPQVYLERLTQGYQGNYFDFYPSIFEGIPYPEGNTSWHHLWFILYLFIYDILLAPLFSWCKNKSGYYFLQQFSWFASGKRLLLLPLPSIILFTCLCLKYPQTNDLIHDLCYFIYWLWFLLIGYLCMATPGIMDSLEWNRRFFLTLGFLSTFLINYLRWNKLEPFDLLPDWQNDYRTYLFLALFPATAWCWVFTAVGYGKKYLNKPHASLNYLNPAVYPFYILHQTVIVVVVYYVVQTSDTILMKFLFTVLLSFVMTMLIYHTLVKPFAIPRFIFGMKPVKKISPFKKYPGKVMRESTTVVQ